MKFELNKEYTEHLEMEEQEKIPSLFQIFLHNDDFTPKEFVIEMLEKLFFMDRVNAASVMMEAHLKGMAVCGEFAKDFAEAKVAQVVDYARSSEHPLICTMEVAV